MKAAVSEHFQNLGLECEVGSLGLFGTIYYTSMFLENNYIYFFPLPLLLYLSTFQPCNLARLQPCNLSFKHFYPVKTFKSFEICKPLNLSSLLNNLFSLTLLLPGCQTNDYSQGGVFRTRSYFQLIWTTFGTRGTIFEQLIVKGVHR